MQIIDFIEDNAEPEGLSYKIIGAAIEVHKNLGPGLLESAYEKCLAYELRSRGMNFENQLELPIKYKENFVNCNYRLDFLVENSIILELKSVEKLTPLHESQLITYLKLSKIRVGILINFNVNLLKEGISRLIL